MGFLDDAYNIGVGVAGRGRVSQKQGEGHEDEIGTPYFTPGSIGQEMLNLASRVKALDYDIKATTVTTDAMKDFTARWDMWVKEFVDWGRRNSNYFDRMFNVTKDQLDAYRAQFDAWRKEFESVGGKVQAKASVEEHTPKKEADRKKENKGWTWWQWAATLGIVAGVGTAAFRWLGPSSKGR